MAARQYRSTVEAKTLSTGINNSVTSMTLNSITTLPSTYPYTLVIDPDTASEEIVTVTANAGGSVLTITRGQDGTSAQIHDAGAVVKHMITARDLQEPQNHIVATADVHGLDTAGPLGVSGGNVVGTTASQTLTNKTLASPTISGTITGAVVTSANIVDGTITGTDVASGTITSTNILDGTIVNADINASAAINPTKVSGTAVTLAGTETLTSKTLTSPVITGGTLNGGAELTVNSTELNYVDGVTSAIQTQLNGKLATTGGTLSGNLTVNGDIYTPDTINFGSGSGDSIVFSETGNTFTFNADGSRAILNVASVNASSLLSSVEGSINYLTSTSITAFNDIDATDIYTTRLEATSAITANEFLTTDNAGSANDPAFASPQGTSGMYFVGGSTITGIRFTVNGTERYQITSSGGSDISSIRTKDNIQTYAVPTEDLLNIRTISYHPKGDERDITAFGVIAEELDEVPSLRIFLDYEEDGSPISVQYDRIALALINVVKEQQERIDSLEQRLTALEAK
jgi:hypothetical protein